MKYFYADKENKAVGPLPRDALDSLKATGIIFDYVASVTEEEWRIAPERAEYHVAELQRLLV